MSNSRQTPPRSTSSYSTGRGRTTAPQQKQPQKPKTVNDMIQPKHMWILFGIWCAGALFMLLFGAWFAAMVMWCLAVWLCPFTERIINKEARNPRSMPIRVVTNRLIRIVCAALIGFIAWIGFFLWFGNSIGAGEPDNVELSPSPSIEVSATPTLTPTATPTATPTQEPTVDPTPTQKPTEDPDVEMVWIVDNSEVYHCKSDCGNMSAPRKVPLTQVENSRRKCKKCY